MCLSSLLLLLLSSLLLNIAIVRAESADQTHTLKCIEEALLVSLESDCAYPPITASQAIRQLRDKWIVFMGESTLRQLFLQFLGIIKSEPFEHIPDRKGSTKMEERLAGSRYTFYYLEYYDNLTRNLSHGPPQLYDGRFPDLLILNDGLHDLLYNYAKLDSAWLRLAQTLSDFTAKYSVPLMWVPSPQIHDSHLTKHRKDSQTFNNATVYAKTVVPQWKLYSETENGLHYFYNVFRNISYNQWNFDGIHNMERARMEAEGLIRAFYFLNQSDQGWNKDELSVGTIMTFLFYGFMSAVVVIGQICKWLFYHKKSKVSLKNSEMALQELESLMSNDGNTVEMDGNTHTTQTNGKPNGVSPDKGKANGNGDTHAPEYELRVPPLFDSLPCLRLFVKHYIHNQQCYVALFQIAVCLIILYLFDGPTHVWVSPALKRYNRDFFIFLHIVFLGISYLTLTVNAREKGKVLSRLQTEEWKGIMQIVFVMYHYFDAAEVYNLIRVFIGAYVWMTGYNNTSFFLRKSAFNLNRICGMLFRLNFLVFWVCLVLGQPLMLYYICPLHTFFFLFVYATWGIAYPWNENHGVKLMKLAISGAVLCLLFESNALVFETVWSPLAFVLNLHGSLYEWHFRTGLDHYATWLGMVFAVYYKDVSAFLSVSLQKRPKCKIGIAVACVAAILAWYECVYRHDKFAYNALHPYTEAIPIFAYILLRNVFESARPWYSAFLAWMGQITLETYIFQYHLYMINDAKSILTVLAGYPLCNFLIVSVFYIWLSRVAFDATNALRNHFYPSRSKDSNLKVLKDTAAYLTVLALFYVVSIIISLSIQ